MGDWSLGSYSDVASIVWMVDRESDERSRREKIDHVLSSDMVGEIVQDHGMEVADD